MRRPPRIDLVVAVLLTLAVELEVLLGPAEGGSRVLTALAAPAAVLPLAWRRRVPLLPLAALAVVLLAQAPLGGYLEEHPLTPLAALTLAIYSAGRHVTGRWQVAGAMLAMAVLAATRIAFDPAVTTLGEAAMTSVVLPLAFLFGRVVRGHDRLRDELGQRARRLEREREHEARLAVEEERTRIAGELHAVITGEVRAIVARAHGLGDRLVAGEPGARDALASIAATARTTLADVRRVLGILRRDDHVARLAPPAAERRRPRWGVTTDSATTGGGAPPATTTGGAPPATSGGGAPPATTTGGAASPATTTGGAASPADGSGGAASPATGAAASATPVWRQALRDPPRADRLLVAVLLLAAQVELALVVPSGSWPAAAPTALLIPLPLLWRRRWPIAAALAALGAIALQSALVGLDAFPASSIAAVVSASYAVGAHTGRRRAVAGLALVALASTAHALAFNPDSVAAALIGGAGFPWTVGRILRNQRLLTAEQREKAAQAEHERALQARSGVVAERSRVARELHDVVAHGISVIAIQAAGAHDLAERDPGRAAQAAALIESVGHEALAELERLFGAPGSTPPPGLARVDGLARRARDGGLPVELRVEGTPAELPAGVDLAAYRIVQEALANTSKHAGSARAHVVVRYHPREVEVEVSDDGRGANGRRGAAHGGHGLIGMRERVALYGGRLDAGREPGGGFRVRASLPIGSA